MIPKNCSRYQTCSANICPLDQHWINRKHLDNDRVCHLLIKAARKETPKESPIVWDQVIKQAPLIWKAHSRIKRKCLKN